MIAATEIQANSQSVNDIHKDIFDRLTDISRKTARKLKLAFQVQHECVELRALSEHDLEDIGIERHIAERESYRSIFDLPSNRAL